MAAMEDEEIDLYADPEKGESAYLPKEQIEVSPLSLGPAEQNPNNSQDAFDAPSSDVSSLEAPDATIRENVAAEQASKEVRA